MQNENTPAEGLNSAQTESESALRDAACSPDDYCRHCGSKNEPCWSRSEPMGYYCPDCGKSEGDVNDTPETDKAIGWACCEDDVVMAMRSLERTLNRTRIESEMFRNQVQDCKWPKHLFSWENKENTHP